MNSINVIAPYRLHGMWVFDDPARGLVQEPFVGGADTMIDKIVAGLRDAHNGFVMVFSSNAFPGSQFELDWRRPDRSGNVYFSTALDAEGWLCPALLKYFDAPPPKLFVAVRERDGAA
ncbi:DUF6717 family protein [Pseudoxanthobacter sp. M-2]|uniref:DUF6717 family protein n=1 Tax=Pseudoxanthobacter sp. M-2 TaxID=3078754 RepID=UPI0038FC8EF9